MAKKTANTMNKWLYIGAIVAILFILLMWYVGTYNALISADQNVKTAWGNVEVQYQRRVDLIPNLVNSVKGYMAFEKEVLTKVTSLRSQWMTATAPEERVATANEIEAALKTIFATYENYPELKADKTVTALMDELAGTENRVAVSRTNYNDAVRNYNNLVKFIPSNIVAGWMGMVEKTMFEAITPGAETAPVVNITA
ncbi:MAG: LemA family protein [Candidatus Aenigmatarchaeota archaeon]